MEIYYGITDFNDVKITKLILDECTNGIYYIIKTENDEPLQKYNLWKKELISAENFDKLFTDTHCIFSHDKKLIKMRLTDEINKQLEELDKKTKHLKTLKKKVKDATK